MQWQRRYSPGTRWILPTPTHGAVMIGAAESISYFTAESTTATIFYRPVARMRRALPPPPAEARKVPHVTAPPLR